MDDFLICLCCGEVIEMPSDRAIKILGKKATECCDSQMAKIKRSSMHTIVRNLDKIQARLEEEILKDFDA